MARRYTRSEKLLESSLGAETKEEFQKGDKGVKIMKRQAEEKEARSLGSVI
jgi:hypothetical protein